MWPVTLPNLPFELSFKIGLLEMPPSSLNGFLSSMDSFKPRKKYQQKPNSQPWFTPECAVVISHHNHHYHFFYSIVGLL